MAKIIISRNDKVLREVMLCKERVTIGRRPHNDVVIDNLAVSAEHAVIVTLNNDSFLEDLNSTNGTQVNGQPVKKHFLQDEDVIELAQYKITFVDGESVNDSNPTEQTGQAAKITILNGVSAGKKTLLTKAITTIGRPDMQIAVIMRQPIGYTIAHVEGVNCLLINDEPIGTDPCQLTHGDVIDISGTRIRFLME